MKAMDIEELIKKILDCAFTVRQYLAQGFEEKIYKNALVIELRDNGIEVKTEVPCVVHYKEHVVGQYRVDLLVENRVIVELKACNTLNLAHEVQLVNYLTAMRIDHGLLINYGGERIECKRKYRVYRSAQK